MRKKIIFFLPLFLLVLSCGTDLRDGFSVSVTGATNGERKWTILLYMAADNNLESDAITDFNEMELASTGANVTVIALIDRAEGYDATNGDWTDTRLYKIKRDSQVNKTYIASERLECPELGLSASESTELDMANPATLSGFLTFARRKFPAEHFALVLWGHGTGWRASDKGSENCRAVALDSASSSYMGISALRSAIEDGMCGKKLSVIAFDTCFGMCLETAFELSGCAEYMLGTPALVPESGWNYTDVLNCLAESDFTATSFIKAASSSYARLYKNYPYACFSCVELSKIPSVVRAFSSCSKNLADSISDRTRSEEIFSALMGKCRSYCDSAYPTDFYLDVGDFARVVGGKSDFSAVETALSETIVSSWSADGKPSSLGVLFCVYQAAGVIQTSHPSAYIFDSQNTDVSRFVRNCRGYVPGRAHAGSLLDKLFYTFY